MKMLIRLLLVAITMSTAHAASFNFKEWQQGFAAKMNLYEHLGFGEESSTVSNLETIEKYIQEHKELLLQYRSNDSEYSSLDQALFSCINVRYSLEEAKSIIGLLVQYGANINVKTDDKKSLLHQLVVMRQNVRFDVKELILFLIEQGIDVNALDVNGKPALAYISKGNPAYEVLAQKTTVPLTQKSKIMIIDEADRCASDSFELTEEEVAYHNQRFDEMEWLEQEAEEREREEEDERSRENERSWNPYGFSVRYEN